MQKCSSSIHLYSIFVHIDEQNREQNRHIHIRIGHYRMCCVLSTIHTQNNSFNTLRIHTRNAPLCGITNTNTDIAHLQCIIVSPVARVVHHTPYTIYTYIIHRQTLDSVKKRRPLAPNRNPSERNIYIYTMHDKRCRQSFFVQP